MSFPSLPIAGEIHLWRLDHREGDLALLSGAEQAQLERYQREEDRRRYGFTQSAKRQILGRYLGQNPSQLSFLKNEHGKPLLAGLEFSISHTARMSVLAVSWKESIGVDIERVKPQLEIGDLIARIASETERQGFATLNETERLRSFYRLWTAKEAYLKNLGIGFEREPSEVETDFPALNSVRAKNHPKRLLVEVVLDESSVVTLSFVSPLQKLLHFQLSEQSP